METIINDVLSAQADELGTLLAQIKALTDKADAIKKDFKKSGYDVIEGDLFKAVIVTKTTCALDSAKVRLLLTPSQVDLCSVDRTSTSVTLYSL